MSNSARSARTDDLAGSNFRRCAKAMVAAGAVACATVAVPLATAGTAAAVELTPSQTHTMNFWTSISLQIVCPDEAPYLVNHDYAPARHVPRGIEVIEDGGIGVTMFETPGRPDREWGKYGNEYIGERAIGAWGTATNWNLAQRGVKIIAHCTSNRAAGWVVN